MINSSSYCISNADDITEVKEGLSDSTYLYRAICILCHISQAGLDSRGNKYLPNLIRDIP